MNIPIAGIASKLGDRGRRESAMMQEGMFWGMGWGHLLGAILVLLVIAALVKYVFFR